MFKSTRNISKRWTSTGEKALNTLADHLAKNYFDTSLPRDLDDESQRRIARQVCAPRRAHIGELRRGRNILVIGAGASVAAFGPQECPATEHAITIIRNRLLEKHGGEARGFIEQRLEQEHARLTSLYELSAAQNDFETQLAVLSSVYSLQDIRNVLVEIYGNRRWPHINFEIIAHLLKHRFVDAIINFNFDELLDQAITEEIGLAQFDYVTSDGHCRNIDDLMIGRRLKVPLYIKPHGTVSHPSTLRFTKHDYLQLPEAMRAFMEKIVRGYWTDRQNEKEVREQPELNPYPTNIISIGFAMRSLEFLQILRGSDTPTALFHINNDSFSGQARALRVMTGVEEQHFINVSRDGLHGVLRTLWKKIAERFGDLYRPRGIARHELVHSVFFSRDGSGEDAGHRVPLPAPDGRSALPASDARAPAVADRPGEKEARRVEELYCTARLCTELVIALARGNGRVDLAAAAEDRVGEYFERLSSLKKRTNEDFSLADIRRLFGDRLEMDGYAENVLIAKYLYRVADPAKASRGFARWLQDGLQEALASLGDPGLSARAEATKAHNGEKFAELLAGLVASDVQTISPDFRHRHLLLFTQPNPDDVLHTNLGLTIRFVELANSLEWDLMLAVSEHGKVMEKYRKHADRDEVPRLAKKWFCVLVARTTHDNVTDLRLAQPEFARRMVGGSGGRRFYRSDFLKQDHHMIVFLKRGGGRGEWSVEGGIQFDKPGQHRQVNPIVIAKRAIGNGTSRDRERNEQDLVRLRNCFFGYVDAAIRAEGGEPERAVSARSDAAAARARAEELLARWWDDIEERTSP